MNYRLFIDYKVIEFMESFPRKDRLVLRNRLVAIQDYPGRFSDYIEYDSEGLRVDIHICGKFAIKFWQDHANKREDSWHAFGGSAAAVAGCHRADYCDVAAGIAGEGEALLFAQQFGDINCGIRESLRIGLVSGF